MKALLQRSSTRVIVTLIFSVGIVRFLLSLGGLPDTTVKYFSMTAVVAAGAVFFGGVLKSHRERLCASYLLILPYMIIEIVALSYTWMSGQTTIFHAPEYSFGSSIPLHTVGHLVGGLTWEPLFPFAFMEVMALFRAGANRALRAFTSRDSTPPQ